MLRQSVPSRFDSLLVGGVSLVLCNRLNVAALRTVLVRNRPEIISEYDRCSRFVNRTDAGTLGTRTFPVSWDSVNDYPVGLARFAFACESNWTYRWQISSRFQVVSDVLARICNARWADRFDSGRSGKGFQPLRFDVIPQDYATRFCNRFDSGGAGSALFSARKQAFVRPGWKILAENIVTNEMYELGFLDYETENPVLENVFLPDGDYEIQVLTSSLFWRDTLDTEVRLISVRPGERLSPLPVLYNLRSTIVQGETTIYWPANQSSVSDCVFGVWYSPKSPVPTDGPPDETVWYSPQMTEYQTSFRQNAPCYVAVAAIRTGNESEMGKIHELYLDWSNTKPRHPDDVVVFDKLLPVYDPNILSIEQENPDLSLWG